MFFQCFGTNRCHPLAPHFYKLEEETWLFSNLNWFLKFCYVIEVAFGLNTSDRKKTSFQQKRQEMAKKNFHALANSISRVQTVISRVNWLSCRFHLSRYILAKYCSLYNLKAFNSVISGAIIGHDDSLNALKPFLIRKITTFFFYLDFFQLIPCCYVPRPLKKIFCLYIADNDPMQTTESYHNLVAHFCTWIR